MTDTSNMPRYVSHKKVHALEISAVAPEPEVRTFRLSFAEPGFADVIPDAGMFSRYMPVKGDFYVVYEDGYKSFSPRKAFLDGYAREGLNEFQQGSAIGGKSFADIKREIKK
jgi:hypothetical protein